MFTVILLSAGILFFTIVIHGLVVTCLYSLCIGAVRNAQNLSSIARLSLSYVFVIGFVLAHFFEIVIWALPTGLWVRSEAWKSQSISLPLRSRRSATATLRSPAAGGLRVQSRASTAFFFSVGRQHSCSRFREHCGFQKTMWLRGSINRKYLRFHEAVTDGVSFRSALR